MSGLADADDWCLALAGDGEAFGRIYDRHAARVRRHVVGLLPGSADADDVVAVVFLEAWRRRQHVRVVNGSLLPWLLVTATNAARNTSRATRRYRALLAKLPDGTAPGQDEAGDEGEATAALATLPLIDRQVVTLCVLIGLSHQDAAALLGIAEGTVKSRLHRAKARLRDRLTPQDDHPVLPEGAHHDP